jgi:hypothetical protein
MSHVHEYLNQSGIPADATAFSVSPGKHRYVAAVGLSPTDSFVLYRKMCQEKNCPNDGTALWGPVVVCGRHYELNTANTLMCINVPGDYYLAAASGTPPAGTSVCIDDELDGSACECGC